MRRLWTGLLLILAGCGTDPALPPMLCEGEPEITVREVFIGDRETVPLCITSSVPVEISAYSDDDDVVEVRVLGVEAVRLTGIGVGTTTVTVRATNESGSLRLEFDARVPNRIPVVREEVEPLRIHVGAEATIDLTGVFEDPDGHDLEFEAESLDERIVEARERRGTLTVEAVGVGETSIEIRAEDEYGGRATLELPVISFLPVVFRDDFDREDDPGEWTLLFDHSRGEITGGRLWLWTADIRFLSTAMWERRVSGWSVETVLGPRNRTQTHIQIRRAIDGEVVSLAVWHNQETDKLNYILLRLFNGRWQRLTEVETLTMPEGITEFPLRLSVLDEGYRLEVGGHDIVMATPRPYTLREFDQLFIAMGTQELSDRLYVEWVEVRGTAADRADGAGADVVRTPIPALPVVELVGGRVTGGVS